MMIMNCENVFVLIKSKKIEKIYQNKNYQNYTSVINCFRKLVSRPIHGVYVFINKLIEINIQNHMLHILSVLDVDLLGGLIAIHQIKNIIIKYTIS